MRIERLAIERYGAFEERSLEFAASAPLTVIFGRNEAGKSTSLAAVKDFLFGVPERTAKTLLYGAEGLRLSASLRMEDGRLLSFRRRKGRARTLTDGEGNPVEEAQLARLLGGISKERFETFFALDHHDLRAGGEDLLTADGEIGRLIIEAGGGLRPLVQRLEDLDAEIDGLFSPQRSAKRAFYKALDTFTTADDGVKAGALKPADYERLRAALEAADRRRDELRDEKALAVRALSKLERSLRVAVPLRRLDDTRAALADLDDVPPLPDDFAELVEAAERRLVQIKEDALQARRRQAGLAARLSELEVDPIWSAAEAEILDLGHKRAVVAKEREDRPNRIRELAEGEQRLAALRRRLSVGPEDDLAGRLPDARDVERVRTLAHEAQTREPKLQAAAERVKELETDMSRLRERLRNVEASARHEPLGVTAAEIASLPSTTQAAEVRRRQALGALDKARDAAVALGVADLAALESTPFPSARRMADELRVLDDIEAELRFQTTAAVAAESEQRLHTAEAMRLAQGGTPATDELVRGARAARAQALAPLREAYRTGRMAADADGRVREVDAADRSVAMADDLADRRAAEAQRAAEHAQALRLGAAAAVREAAARSELARLNAVMAARTKALADAFRVATELHPQPRALEEAAGRREAALTAAAAARALLEQAEADASQLIVPLDLLGHVERVSGLEQPAGAPIAERVRKALVAIAAHEEIHAGYRRDAAALEASRTDLRVATDRLETLTAEQADWRSAWASALPKLGLDIGISLDDAAAATMEWAAAEGVLTTQSATRRRLDRMDEDEQDLALRADLLAERLGLRLPEDPLAKVELLQRRGSEHQAQSTRRETLSAELREHQQEAEAAEAAVAEAMSAVERLCRQASVAQGDEAALAQVRRKHLDRRRLRSAHETFLQTLAAAGDGLSEAELRADWQGADPDALRAEEARLAGDVHALEMAHNQAIAVAVRAMADFDDALDEKGFTAALAAREGAIADLHLVAERYVPLALARDLLKDVIGQARARQQDPLIARAGALMSTLTLGAFSGVAADIDDKGQPVVVGVNRAGGSIPVRLMSDGARDQLYLAFRLAGLESYCAAAEPLPFVADDLLVHFDDARTAAALEVLADFGATTQVLLFTHHESVRDAAARLAASGRSRIVELS
jgi:uncharacterized protein YhaN